MTKKLIFCDDGWSLPIDYATSRNMVLAQSGAGKSNACAVLAEQMHHNRIPWITIDPKGDWYGVRSNRSGKQRGLDVPVFGPDAVDRTRIDEITNYARSSRDAYLQRLGARRLIVAGRGSVAMGEELS